MTPPLADKTVLRREMLALRAALDGAEVARASLAVAARVRELVRWRGAAEVLAYWPTKNEIDTRPLVAELWARGARVLLPRCRRGEPGLADLACVAREADLAPGAFSLLEPGPACPLALDAAPDVVLVPGVAFDRLGRRLGFGGGYYDRILARPGMDGALVVGLAHAFQLLPELPADPWDRPVDVLCADGETLWFK